MNLMVNIYMSIFMIYYSIHFTLIILILIHSYLFFYLIVVEQYYTLFSIIHLYLYFNYFLLFLPNFYSLDVDISLVYKIMLINLHVIIIFQIGCVYFIVNLNENYLMICIIVEIQLYSVLYLINFCILGYFY